MKKYNPENFEEKIYEYWEKQKYFKLYLNPNKENYCIIMPPPNITGNLHIGHALQQTIMDIMIRYNRMKGKNVLWQFGLDHAGISMQIIMENKIEIEEKKNRNDYSRQNFISKIWKWKNMYCDSIKNQMKRLGYSVNWEKERFTLDKKSSYAVKKAFIDLYHNNLIYKKKRLVNWDIKLQTAISDLEVKKKEKCGFLWYIRYPIVNFENKYFNEDHYIVVATTRPETIFGDVAIVVNPKDPRYFNVVGQYASVPLIDRKIPILSDKNVDIEKGTGCMKVTPGHDFEDFIIGQNHFLPIVNILTLDGKIRKEAEVSYYKNNLDKKQIILNRKIPKKFQGLKCVEARIVLLNELKKLNFLEKKELHSYIVPYSEKSGEIIEPMITDQWYMRTTLLSKKAKSVVENGFINFFPKKYKNDYFKWIENMQDWCISRQLWWGHRIPVWYDSKKNIYVGMNEFDVRKKYNIPSNINLIQDNDVLDTWFSSSLWSFISLGWPKNTKDFCRFYPTNLIVSGFDIIFFWIARMIMLAMYFIKDKKGNSKPPFKDIYITGLICDQNGKKMSKSKGNVIDPIDIINGISLKKLLHKSTEGITQTDSKSLIENYIKKKFPYGIKPHGADALRFSLISSVSSNVRRICWDINLVNNYKKFCNKLWNASKFVLLQIEKKNFPFSYSLTSLKKIHSFSLHNNWIISELHKTIKIFRNSLDNYRFDIASKTIYKFVWNQFCDWYIEIIKIEFKISTEKTLLQHTYYVMFSVLETILKLIHPIAPFITEIIWDKMKKKINILEEKKYTRTIMFQSFPIWDDNKIDENSIKNFNWIRNLISIIRSTRSELNISKNQLLSVYIKNIKSHTLIEQIEKNINIFLILSKLRNLFLNKEKNSKNLKFLIEKKVEDIEIIFYE